MTTTLLSSMGSRVVLPGSGVLMNNGVMWFDPRPGQPNSAGPGKRPLTNMCPSSCATATRPRPRRRRIRRPPHPGRRHPDARLRRRFRHGPGRPPRTTRASTSATPTPSTPTSACRPTCWRRCARRARSRMWNTRPCPVNFACPNLIQIKDGVRTGISDVMSPWSAAVAQAWAAARRPAARGRDEVAMHAAPSSAASAPPSPPSPTAPATAASCSRRPTAPPRSTRRSTRASPTWRRSAT